MIEKTAKIKRIKSTMKRFNKFGNYHYRNTDDIVETANTLLCAERTGVLTLSDEWLK